MNLISTVIVSLDAGLFLLVGSPTMSHRASVAKVSPYGTSKDRDVVSKRSVLNRRELLERKKEKEYHHREDSVLFIFIMDALFLRDASTLWP